ncbi:hypothetical protein GCM10022285_35150 [Streptomyces tunisiensis]|uniref:Uncharacterized protein n=1 Tax=Streptomyces tunisiensis TaxID=948699 RepID=A0ABP7YLU4_9ACTN
MSAQHDLAVRALATVQDFRSFGNAVGGGHAFILAGPAVREPGPSEPGPVIAQSERGPGNIRPLPCIESM